MKTTGSLLKRHINKVQLAINSSIVLCLLVMMLVSCTVKTGNDTKIPDDFKASQGGFEVTPSTSSAVQGNDVFDTKKYEGHLRVYYFDFSEPKSGNVNEEDSSEDCTLIITPDNKAMLIDAARPELGKKILGYLDKLGIKKIDIAVASHRHIDHVGGYPDVIANKTVDRFMMAKASPAPTVLDALAAKNIKPEYPDDGTKFKLGNDVEFEVFADDSKLDKISSLKENELTPFINNHTMVLRMTYKNNSFLFAGDVYKDREGDLAYGPRSIDSDVLKVPHHGYATSSTSNFIKKVSPKYAVIETWAITKPEVVLRYQQSGAKVYTTALNGNVLITSDGINLAVVEEKKTGKN